MRANRDAPESAAPDPGHKTEWQLALPVTSERSSEPPGNRNGSPPDRESRALRLESFLFGDRGKNSDSAEPQFQNGFRRVSLFISNPDAMDPIHTCRFHFIGNGVIPVAGKTIHAGP